MANFAAITGVKELDDSLSYLRDRSSKRIGRKMVRRMAVVGARGIRKSISKSIAPRTPDKGIGHRPVKTGGLASKQKVGIAVGKAGVEQFTVVNRGRAVSTKNRFRFNDKTKKSRRATGQKFQRMMRVGRRGVGVTAKNLHWFGAGTKDRLTGGKLTWVDGGRKRVSTGRNVRRTGRIDKAKWGGFVQRGMRNTQQQQLSEARQIFDKEVQRETNAARAHSH